MDFRQMAYELYKLDWMRRISTERQMDEVKNWYQECDRAFREEYTWEDWIEDNGYSGELYVCYDEFLGAEYFDREYMKALLDNDELFEEYENDIQELI